MGHNIQYTPPMGVPGGGGGSVCVRVAGVQEDPADNLQTKVVTVIAV